MYMVGSCSVQVVVGDTIWDRKLFRTSVYTNSDGSNLVGVLFMSIFLSFSVYVSWPFQFSILCIVWSSRYSIIINIFFGVFIS